MIIFSTSGDFAPRAIWQGLGTLLIVTLKVGGGGNATSLEWVEANDAATYPTTHRTVSIVRNDPVPSVRGAEVETP